MPLSGRIRPNSIRSSVVLPAPLGPSSPRTSPARSTRSTPSTAVVAPKRLTSPVARTACTRRNIASGRCERRRGRVIRVIRLGRTALRVTAPPLRIQARAAQIRPLRGEGIRREESRVVTGRAARRRGRVVIAAALASCVAVVGVASAAVGGFNPFASPAGLADLCQRRPAARPTSGSRRSGTRILDNNARLVSSTISPNGQYLAALGWNDFSGFLTIVDLQDRQDRLPDRASTAAPAAPRTTRSRPDGPLFSSDGTHALGPAVDVPDKFSFDQTTGAATQDGRDLRCAARRLTSSDAAIRTSARATPSGAYLPSGMALSPDGNKLYVALNGANTLGVIDTADRHADQADPGRQRAAPGRARRQRHGRLRLQRGRPPGEQRRVHQPVRRHADRLEPQDRRGDHRHRLGRQPDDRQGGAGDPGRPPADGALSGRRRSVRRQLQRRQPVGDRREDQHGRSDGPDQPGPRRPGRQLRQRDQHVGPEARAGQHRPRQRDRGVRLPRLAPAYDVRRAAPDRLVPRPGPARPGARAQRSSSPTTRASAHRASNRRSTRVPTRLRRPATTPTTTPAASRYSGCRAIIRSRATPRRSSPTTTGIRSSRSTRATTTPCRRSSRPVSAAARRSSTSS